jgi:hypothetical protein
MPTPTGLLRKGDLLIHPKMPGVLFEVAERIGIRRDDYSIRIRRQDGEAFRWGGAIVTEAAIVDAHFYVFNGRGGWELAEEEAGELCAQPAKRTSLGRRGCISSIWRSRWATRSITWA